MKPDIVLHHAPCLDGFTAAWAVWKKYPDCEFIPGVYGKPPPDVTGKNVVLVDFSYKRDVLEAMGAQAKRIYVLDHHKTAQADLEPFTHDFEGPILAEFDMERSGAQMAWDFYHPGEPRPKLVDYVGDRDLWKFALPDSKAISLWMFSFEYDFESWNTMADILERETGRIISAQQGAAIERKHQKDIRELLEQSRRTMKIGGFDNIPVANLPYTMASDAAGMMAASAPFGACYFDRSDGLRQFSLRSRGLGGADVSAIASLYGGGGHKNAAGFQVTFETAIKEGLL